MTATLTQRQDMILWASILGGLVWVVFWAFIWFMAFRVLRWTYLEKKAAHRGGIEVEQGRIGQRLDDHIARHPAPPARVVR